MARVWPGYDVLGDGGGSSVEYATGHVPYHFLADLIVVVHVTFVAFAVAGGLLVLRWRWVAWLHVPAFVWAALIEFGGWACPLTPLENALRERAGVAHYSGGFVQHYLLRALYPSGLTRGVQLVLGCGVLAINGTVYSVVLARRRRVEGARMT